MEATVIREARLLSHETPEKSFSNLGVLSWFSNNPDRRPSWLNNGSTKWFAARQLLATFDYRKVLPIAIWQYQEFEARKARAPRLTESEMKDQLRVMKSDFITAFKNVNASLINNDNSLDDPSAYFGKPDLDGDVLRIYVNPKTDRESYKRTMEMVAKIFSEKQVEGQLKGYLDDVFHKLPNGWYIPSSPSNRLVIYLDAKNGENITRFLQGLADSSIFPYLEDSGAWAYTAKIPISNGINLVEGTSRSWDYQGSHEIGLVDYIKTQTLWKKKSFPQILNEVMSWKEGVDLVRAYTEVSQKPPPRNPNMPALLINSPLRKL